jgi:hypothetical protein
VEPARSADVPPELAPRIASGAAVGAALRKGQASVEARRSVREQNKTGQTHELAGKESDIEQGVKADVSAQSAGVDSSSVDAFMGQPDGPIREALRSKGFVAVEKGRGGRSLGFKVTLEGGQKGYFKGEQIFSAANWFGEVASYHLDRMLGLGRVPAVVSRQVAWTQLEPAVGADWRRSEMIIRGGQLRGAFVAWVDGGVRPMKQQEGWERWMRVKYWPTSAVSPFQRPAVWGQEIVQAKRMGIEWRSKEERARLRNLRPEPDRPDRPSELSDLIVFDYLIRNLDRWGGGNANVVTRGDKGPLIFLDNAAGFEPGEPRPSLMEARLHALQRFRRRTIAAIKAFDIKKFEARLQTESLQPVLGPGQIEGLEMRRKALLSWVAELEAAYGEAIWAWE